MRKLFAVLALLLVFTIGCKKDEEMKLSEFIIGEWDSELTTINPGQEDETLVYFYTEFKTDNTFDLDFLTYPDKLPMYSFADLNYTINNEFNMTIDNPMEEGTVSFDIVWNSGYDKMVWVPNPDDGAPTMVFTKRKMMAL
jgi:hypothetical protein